MEPKFRYNQAARSTVYNGTEYRSELEATWAAFFDIRRIEYEYEPLLSLRAWRPDFLITMRDDGGILLAEVKPYHNESMWLEDESTLSKIRDSHDGHFIVVLLGASPLLRSSFQFGTSPGIVNPLETIRVWSQINFGDSERLSEDWKEAKNAARWKP